MRLTPKQCMHLTELLRQAEDLIAEGRGAASPLVDDPDWARRNAIVAIGLLAEVLALLEPDPRRELRPKDAR